jgi:hypothetical protein
MTEAKNLEKNPANNKKYKPFRDYNPPYENELLDQTIDILNLSAELVQKLQSGKVHTLRDIAVRCPKNLYSIPTFNKRDLVELKSSIDKKGFSLRDDSLYKSNLKKSTPNTNSSYMIIPSSNNKSGASIVSVNNKPKNKAQPKPKMPGLEGYTDSQGGGSELRVVSVKQNTAKEKKPESKSNALNKKPINRNSNNINPEWKPKIALSNTPQVGSNDRAKGRINDLNKADQRHNKANKPDNDKKDIIASSLPAFNKNKKPDVPSKPNGFQTNQVSENSKIKQKNQPKPPNDKISSPERDLIKEFIENDKALSVIKKTKPKRKFFDDHPIDKYIKINRNGKWGFVHRSGKQTVIQPIYDDVFTFKEDLCCVEKDSLFGFINRKGIEVIPIEYECALSFSEGYACVYKDGRCGYIDTNNQVVIKFEFEAGTSVEGGSCRIKKNGKWGEMSITDPTSIRWII